MPSDDVVRSAIASAARLSRQAGGEARAAKARVLVKAGRLLHERRRIQDESAEARVWRRILGVAFPVPFLRGMLLANFDRRTAALDARAEAIDVRVDDLRRAADAFMAHDARAEKAYANLGRAKRAAGELGAVPADVAVSATTCLGQADFLLRSKRGGGWIEDALASSEAVVGVVRAWAKARVKAEEVRRSLAVRKDVAKGVAPAQRIYLPVPQSGARAAIRLGAMSDDAIRSGESRAFVTMDMDLTPFRDMLPLAFRAASPRFEFPPIPYRATSQNLWGLFDKETWNHVRHSSYDMAGRRCLVCGKRGGWFADKVFTAEERRGGVDCHEVWEWSLPDPGTGVGIQRLARILVVCPDCHMLFHEGYAKRRAEEVGLKDQAIDMIAKRRATINRVDPATLQRSVESTRQAYERLTGVDRWIVDLTTISQQQFMADRTPVMRESNDAAMPPSRIAGMAFETDSNRAFPARSARDIYADLVADVRESDHNVVAMPRR